MNNPEQREISGFFNLLNCHFDKDLYQRMNARQGCLSTVLKDARSLSEINLHLFWDEAWLSLGIWVNPSDFISHQQQDLLNNSPCHFQCAIDHHGKLHLISKFKRGAFRQEEIYQRYFFLLEKLRTGMTND